MKSVMVVVAIVVVLIVTVLCGTANAQPNWGGLRSANAAPTISAPGPAPTPTVQPAPPKAHVIASKVSQPASTLLPGNIYLVKKGDTLFSIALRFGVSQFELARVNRIWNPGLIIIGQPLLIPVGYGLGYASGSMRGPVPNGMWPGNYGGGFYGSYWGPQMGWGGWGNNGCPTCQRRPVVAPQAKKLLNQKTAK